MILRTRKPKKVPIPFVLPGRNANMKRAFGYLVNTRGISRELVHAFAHEGLIYESAKYHNAMDNIAQRPPLFQNIESVIFGEREKLEIDDIEPENYNKPFFILTNQQKTKGTVMAVSPKTMDRIAVKFGDVYVIPSSVHETLIVPKDAVDDVSQLEKMVRDVNASEVSPEDQLSNHIYEYDSETHTLKIANGDQTEAMHQDDSGDSGPNDGGNAKELEKDEPDENQDEGQRMAM